MSQTTIKDIAAKLNISPSTVSRALHNHPKVTDETKRKVREMAKTLNYHPDSVARSLKKQSSNIIGVIVPQVKHYFFAAIMSGITDIAYKAGYTVMIFQSNEDYHREVMNTRAVISQRAAGLLVSLSRPTHNYAHFEELLARGIPLVFFDRVCHELEANKVIVDDFDGAMQATEHLIERGYRRIAHLAGPQNLSIGKERLAGYRTALEKNNRPYCEELVVIGGLNEEDGMSGFLELLQKSDEKPDALFAVTDPVAIGAYTKMKEQKIRIPTDIALVGFSDSPIASLIDPPLSTVRQPAYEIGVAAAKLLLQQIENKSPENFPETIVLKTELIIRQSS